MEKQNDNKSKLIRTLIGILIGGFFLFWTLNGKDLGEVKDKLLSANWFWITVATVLLMLTFMLRAWRWKLLFENMNFAPKYRHVLYATLLGYFYNSFTPKFGEVLRCTTLAQKSDIPVANSIGSVVSERIYDIIVLFLGLFVIVLVEFERLRSDLLEMWTNVSAVLSENILLAIVFIVVMIAVSFLAWRQLKKANFYEKIEKFLKEMFQSLKQSFQIKQYKTFLFLTIAIWGVLAVMNYAYLMSLPDSDGYSMYFATVVLFVGALGWALPSPGGMGTTHFFLLQLFLAFDLSGNDGVTFGILSNGLTFMACMMFGFVALGINALSSKGK